MTHREVIVCVDDEETVLRVLQHQLSVRFGQTCQIATATSGEEAVALFDELDKEEAPPAVVIADQIMPGMHGVDLLEIVDRRYPLATKVLLTGQAGLDAVIGGINRAHLNYYMAKPWDEMALGLVVENLLRQFRLAAENRRLVDTLSAKNHTLLEMNRELEAKIHERTHELAEANARLGQLAVTDGLTGLYNHRHFHERLALEVERSQRSGRSVSLLMIDVDHFKLYNDTYGHPAGDEILRQLAQVLSAERRANDVVARYGGEEFAVILVDSSKFTAAKIAEKMRGEVYAHDFPRRPRSDGRTDGRNDGRDGRDRDGRLSISVGVATFPDDATEPEALVRAADSALYAAKRSGRNRIVLAPVDER